MIEVNNLVKRYGDHVAVDDLSFTIEDGKIYGLLGPNGAGKSTTMNMITGYLCANEGSVSINGFDMFKQPEKAKAQIGYLPEIPPLYPDMTVGEYLEFVCELKKVPRADLSAEVARVCEKTGVSDVAGRLIKNLSKGYKQRVGIAQALIGSPSIIILDEPTVGLDPLQIIEIRELIMELGKEHTVILSSHILSEVNAVCDEIMIISKGKLVAQDTADNLSKLSEGKHMIKLLVKSTDEKQVTSVLSGISAVGVYRSSKTTEGISLEIEVENKAAEVNQADLRETLFYAFADAKLPILEMNMEKASLEEVFIELTKEAE